MSLLSHVNHGLPYPLDGSVAPEAPIAQDRCHTTIAFTNPHVTQIIMSSRALSVTDSSVALSEALVIHITQYNNANPTSPVQFYPHNPLSILEGLMLPKTSSLNISKSDKRATISHSSFHQQKHANKAVRYWIVLASSPIHLAIRLPPYSCGYISVPSRITNDELDSFLSEHGVSSLQVARVMYPAPSSHIPKTVAYFVVS